jgi:hypothetical protein
MAIPLAIPLNFHAVTYLQAAADSLDYIHVASAHELLGQSVKEGMHCHFLSAPLTFFCYQEASPGLSP